MVGIFQTFAKPQGGGGGGTVNAATNGVTLIDPQTVGLGSPLIQDTLIEGGAFDLVFGGATPIDQFGVNFQNEVLFSSLPFGGDTQLQISNSSFTQVAVSGAATNVFSDNSAAHSHNIINGVGDSFAVNALADNYTRSITDPSNSNTLFHSSSEMRNEVFDGSSDNEIRRFSDSTLEVLVNGGTTIQRNMLTGGISEGFSRSAINAPDTISVTEFIGTHGLGMSDATNSYNQTTTPSLQQRQLTDGVSTHEMTINNSGFFGQSDNASSQLFYSNSLNNVSFTLDSLVNPALTQVSYQEGAVLTEVTNILGDVSSFTDGGTQVERKAESGGVENGWFFNGGTAGFMEVRTDSNLGIREEVDYSANYTALNLVNKTYADGHVGGLNITNSPSSVGDVLRYDGGSDASWQSASSGMGLQRAGSIFIANITGGFASANDVKYIKWLCPADIDIVRLRCFVTSVGADTTTLGVYDSANNLLVQANVVPSGLGINQTAAFPAVSLTGGQEYWLALKGTVGATNYGFATCFNSATISQSQFFGGAGIPNPKAGASNNQAPFISVSAT